MKKIACVVLLLLLIGTLAFASDNQSAAWVRTLCREAVTDSIDATYFNPAGTAFLEKGLHVQAMNLSVLQTYSHFSIITSNTYEADTPVWFFPTARIGYNGGSWAAFFDFNIPAGGGSLNYDEGAVYVDGAGASGGSFQGSSAVMAFNLGGAYRFGDKLSIGASGRFLYSTETLDGKLDDGPNVSTTGEVAAEASGIGFGGMFSVDFIPFAGFTLAVTVETIAKIEMEYTSVTGDPVTKTFLEFSPLAIAQGNTFNADLPWRIRTGFAYEMPFGLTASATFKFDFYEAMDSTLRNTYSVAGSLAYDITDRIEASLGGSYGFDEIPDVEDYNPLNPELSSYTLAGGVGVEVIEGLVIDLGSLYVFYQPESASGVSGFTDMDKNVLLFAIGTTYSF